MNGQIIGKTVVPDGNVNTYFGRLGIIHQKMGVRMEVGEHSGHLSLPQWQASHATVA